MLKGGLAGTAGNARTVGELELRTDDLETQRGVKRDSQLVIQAGAIPTGVVHGEKTAMAVPDGPCGPVESRMAWVKPFRWIAGWQDWQQLYQGPGHGP